MKLQIDNAGFSLELDVPDDDIERVHRSVLARLERKAEAAAGRAVCVVAGAPGCGKSTLCAIWQALAEQRKLSLKTVSLDGFHLPNDVLHARNLFDRKGSPESFDLDALRDCLERVHRREEVLWPVYDRTRHEAAADGVKITDERIVVVEGNYLLLDCHGWRHVAAQADLTVMIHPDRRALHDRIVARHMQGGMSEDDAEHKFLHNDEANIALVESESLRPDISLLQSADGRYRIFCE